MTLPQCLLHVHLHRVSALHISGTFFDGLNPFKGTTSLDPRGFRVSARGTTGCQGTLLPCVQRKATLKSHIKGQLTSFPHCSVTPDETLLEFVCFRYLKGALYPICGPKEHPVICRKGHLLSHFIQCKPTREDLSPFGGT